MKTITAKEVRQLKATGHVVAAYPRKDLIVVDGFKRYSASQSALDAAANKPKCTCADFDGFATCPVHI